VGYCEIGIRHLQGRWYEWVHKMKQAMRDEARSKLELNKNTQMLLLLATCLLAGLEGKKFSSTLKMEAICSSETSVESQQTTRRHIPEDDTLHNHLCENLKSYKCYLNVHVERVCTLEDMFILMLSVY
jgi:hypothetical protein